MSSSGWKKLTAGAAWFRKPGRYPIPAYSEFMPPPRVGCKAYGRVDPLLFSADDPWGWHVTEYEEAFELQPGLSHLATLLLHVLRRLGRCEPAEGIAHNKLVGNPYWPEELQAGGAPAAERYLLLSPLALSRTQDDKGRVRWTLFGGSELGPERAFWRSFFQNPKQEAAADTGLGFFRQLLRTVYGESDAALADLRKAGLRILAEGDPQSPFPSAGPWPSWVDPLRWSPRQPLRGVRYLLAFWPFARLPAAVRRAYRQGDLHLLPFPGSLVYWGAQRYSKLADLLPFARQIPLLQSCERHEAPRGIRVPQSGWMHEKPASGADHGVSHAPFRNTFHRTHRWARIHRHQDELAAVNLELDDRVAHVLFSAAADDIGLYGKPMARNAQVWTHNYQLLLDGPRAARDELTAAAEAVAAGGQFGYRFLYPPMRVGRHDVYWHRPLVAWWDDATQTPCVLPHAPLGVLTAYGPRGPAQLPVELWPRLLDRSPHRAAVGVFHHNHDQRYHVTTVNIRKLLDAYELLGRQPLPRSFARQLLTVARHETLESWLDELPHRAEELTAGRALADDLRSLLVAAEPADGRKSSTKTLSPWERAAAQPPSAAHSRIGSTAPLRRATPKSLTFSHTAKRSFETAYWNTIYRLASGQYVNKDNADCVDDEPTRKELKKQDRDLEALGDHLLDYYAREIRRQRMSGKALTGELPFQWETEFDYPWQGGWSRNQQRLTYERDIVTVIPGRDRRRAVIMGDHYDTAYMEDRYGYTHGGGGPRLAAAGADDNHSATATLMLAAPILLEMSRQGKLASDVWLIHLTGEEFPSDCLGARHLCQKIVEGDLRIRLTNGRWKSLAKTRVQGVYVLDMVAHNNDRDCDVFQICPGTSRESMWLARQAHEANRIWNESAPQWNHRAARKKCQRGRRCTDGKTLPETALYPQLSGEVRPTIDPRSTLFNTDGQIFSDAGVPVVLFMENYDINRHGYHDSHDTMENIDLDYGAAVAAIAIESVARAATEPPPS